MKGLADLLGALVAAYPQPAPTPERMRSYMLALADLADLPPEAYLRAYQAITRTDREFYPAPGVVREALDPGPTAAELATLYGEIEAMVVTARPHQRGKLIQLVEATYGPAARAAFVAAGGTEAVWRMHEGREFRLKAFRESFVEESRSPRALIGTMDERVNQLVASTAQRLTPPRQRIGGPK